MEKTTKKDMEYKILLTLEKTFYWAKSAELDARRRLGADWREDVHFIECFAAYRAINRLRLELGLDASDGRYALDEDYSWFIEHSTLVLDELRELRKAQKSLG